MKTIILVRHGESQTNLEKIFTGQLDAPLTERGRTQAERMAQYLDQYKVDKIYASSLQRAVQTAQAICARQNCPIEPVEALREMNAGAWQGLPFEKIAEQFPENYQNWRQDISKATPEGGETCAELYNRVTAFFQEILCSPEQTVCLVAHATPIRMLESYIKAGSVSVAQQIPWVPNASVTVYQYDGKFHEVVRGCCDYLEGLQTNLPKNI